MARRLASALLLQQQLPVPACSLQQLASSASWARQFHATGEQQGAQQQQQQPQQLPSLPNLLSSSSATRRSPMALGQGLQTLLFHHHHQVRGMAGGGLDPTTAENTWLTYKSKYAEEKPNDLGQAMYAMILTFGFSWWLNSIFAYPARVQLMLGVVFYVLYMRR